VTGEGGQHRAGDPDDRRTLNGQWHVGRSFIGMFPTHEAKCPCPKARCGLAAPQHDISCEQHMGIFIIRQSHHAKDCDAYVRMRRKRGSR
jgi:hypothetical protein